MRLIRWRPRTVSVMAEASFGAHNSIADHHHDSRNHNDLDHMVPARGITRRHGISERTLDRRIASGYFPKPDHVTRDKIGRVSGRLWWFSTVTRWEQAQAEAEKAG
jgi:hypothetical protein